MKKIDNKGFTLVELLATLVILAVVVGVAVPISNHLISNSKYKALGVMVDSAEKFVSDQWKIKKADPDTMTEAFKNKVKNYSVSNGTTVNWISLDALIEEDRLLIEDMGIPTEGVSSVDFAIYEDGFSCVVISKIPDDSNIYNSTYWTKVDEGILPTGVNDRYYSKCCSLADVQALFNMKYGDGE